MTKFRSVKSALLTSVVSLFLCVAMLVGSTFAWFTDSVTSGQNVIKTGTLDIKLEYSVFENGAWTDYAEVTNTTDIFGYDNWEPGYVEKAKFRITNIGSLDLKYSLTADVYSETAGKNVNGDTFLLSDYLYTQVVDADATRDEILASTKGKRLKAPTPVSTGPNIVNEDLIVSNSNLLKDGESKEVALAIWMPTNVGNEANYREIQPSITFGINLVATQAMNEVDSFGNNYDAAATYPIVAWGYEPVTGANTEIDLLLATGAKVGYMDVPTTALKDGAKDVEVIVKEIAVDKTVTVAADEEAKTFEITVTNIKDGNTEPIKVMLDVGTGLTGVKVFHKNVEITPVNYDATKGMVTFFTTSFSPYTVTYDAVAVEESTENLNTTIPVADLEQVTLNEIITWTGWGDTLKGTDNQLDAVYLFQSPDTSASVDKSIYKDWYCDYYVMLESANLTVLPKNSITLGGNYGGYGWVGFNNPEVNANEYIPLLASAVGRDQNATWTYEAVVDFVTEFWCGVGVADANTTDLSDAKFVVELRLTNPADSTDIIVCNKVVYDFATGSSVITEYPNTMN